MVGLVFTWWAWLAGAFALGILEMAVPGFIFLGFAIGAALTALIVAVAGPSLSVTGIMLIFAVLSLIAWLVLQRVFSLKKGQVKTFDTDINDG